MSKFFIERPIFAWVIAIVIMLAGLFAVVTLPVEQYPKIAPPSISISTSYPGASAEVVENSVAQVIEQNLTGIDYLRYFSSSSDSNGQLTITLTFEPEADPDIAQVQVQNKVQAVKSLLPQAVQTQGVTVKKASKSFLLVAGIYSEDGKMSGNDISDYIKSNMAETLSRVQGVGDLTVFGDQHSMRIWINPEKLHSYSLMPSDITAAIQARNVDVTSGQLGGSPAVAGQQLNASISVQSKLKTVADFENILVKVNGDGSQVRLGDLARVELGSQSYSRIARYKGMEASAMAVTLSTGANALETASRVKAKIKELSAFMPQGLNVAYPYDTTPFVKLSIEEVVKTLIEAIVLVFFVMYLFLQNFRATLIPTIAVPVVLLGTFGVLSAFGFSINVLTMFAMVLAIGLLVDDAIVVVENVERVMGETGLSPKEATRQSMSQITGALVGIAMVLSAVFIPMAFFSGATGAIYRQFSITIVSAMVLSVIVALVLTPALCSTFLKPVKKGHNLGKKGFFGWFNKSFDAGKSIYRKSVGYAATRAVRFIIVYLIIVGGLVYMFKGLPTAFLPDEDQGTLMMMISAPPGATMERTLASIKKVEAYFLNEEAENVNGLFTVTGFSFAGNGQNVGLGFVQLTDWDERQRPDQKSAAIAQRAMKNLYGIKDAMVYAFIPPPINELGNATGFDFQLVDRAGLGHTALIAARNQMLGMASQNPKLVGVRPNGLADVPQYKLDIDYEKAEALGVSTSDITSVVSTAWGSAYVNDFMDKGRVKKVYMQGDTQFRMLPQDINLWYVRNSRGEMVPFSSFAKGIWDYGSPKLERYNGSSSQEILGAPAPGVSSGEAMEIIEDLAQNLPQGIGLDWTGISYEERMAGSQTTLLYSVSLLFVFLCLAALYESWSIPFSVMLVVPLGVIGSVGATLWAGLSNDVYFQIGLLTTIGLAAKNAILIVAFAKELYEKGTDLVTAAKIAAEQRLRPILMTSFAFILGVTPLAVANGAGSASQNAIGIGVIGGMAAATSLAIIFVPLFFVILEKMTEKRKKAGPAIKEVTHAQ
ncbi:RND efflux pump (AcrB/AcrD/AcrF family protein) [Desulforapulum autotrophicum HRM2]|uniref:RND efflux pump (AcrB/AcrD/AcrF family protein) n=1 Tax=Desulforapulum autotrophicum (strain ATCC 43914 / DSM 3382 / VKM B-1955 / HRM2) TaxID=177437 RepID=C0QAA6_DESAH|nr:efflux RND transporter permease subunit [Desulforapulum autotrophicum]ACN14691.1 RND efflux pump (AcrB/AcrD/AcrF family protein) [Desulforapulum autotrophicum HRM2]